MAPDPVVISPGVRQSRALPRRANPFPSWRNAHPSPWFPQPGLRICAQDEELTLLERSFPSSVKGPAPVTEWALQSQFQPGFQPAPTPELGASPGLWVAPPALLHDRTCHGSEFGFQCGNAQFAHVRTQLVQGTLICGAGSSQLEFSSTAAAVMSPVSLTLTLSLQTAVFQGKAPPGTFGTTGQTREGWGGSPKAASKVNLGPGCLNYFW